MSELEPLLSSDATEFERQLLTVAAEERPSPELQLRMERALGLEPGALPAPDASVAGGEPSGTRAVVKARATPRVGGALLRAALGVGAGVGLVAGGLALFASEPFSSEPPAARTAAPANRASAPAPAPAEPTRAAAPAMDAPRADMSRELREEVDLLDRVRAAVAQGDAPTAAALLDGYFARFPEGALVREAGVLRSRAAELARAKALPSTSDGPPR